MPYSNKEKRNASERAKRKKLSQEESNAHNAKRRWKYFLKKRKEFMNKRKEFMNNLPPQLAADLGLDLGILDESSSTLIAPGEKRGVTSGKQWSPNLREHCHVEPKKKPAFTKARVQKLQAKAKEENGNSKKCEQLPPNATKNDFSMLKQPPLNSTDNDRLLTPTERFRVYHPDPRLEDPLIDSSQRFCALSSPEHQVPQDSSISTNPDQSFEEVPIDDGQQLCVMELPLSPEHQVPQDSSVSTNPDQSLVVVKVILV